VKFCLSTFKINKHVYPKFICDLSNLLENGFKIYVRKFNQINFYIHLLENYNVEVRTRWKKKTEPLIIYTRNWELLNPNVLANNIYIEHLFSFGNFQYWVQKTTSYVFSTFVANKIKLLVTFTSLFGIEWFKFLCVHIKIKYLIKLIKKIIIHF